MTLKHLPTQERPREKFLTQGAESVTNTELLAILVGSGQCGRSAVEIARDLLTQAGTLQKLFHMSKEEFIQIKGVSTVTYCRLQATSELFNRQLEEYLVRDDPLANPDVTRRFLISKLRHLQHEVFAVLYLDNAHRLIQFDILFEGTINSANVYPRRVLQEAMRYNAAAIILAHNHP
ncbi:MAG: DNA repair protein RadC, partial [Gammaproteobacteria bacterium]|nr:DNA repair protein RadC [Gammaproteobacteria bacterium]